MKALVLFFLSRMGKAKTERCCVIVIGLSYDCYNAGCVLRMEGRLGGIWHCLSPHMVEGREDGAATNAASKALKSINVSLKMSVAIGRGNIFSFRGVEKKKAQFPPLFPC